MNNKDFAYTTRTKAICGICTFVAYVGLTVFCGWFFSDVTITDTNLAIAIGPVLSIFMEWPVIIAYAAGNFVSALLLGKPLLFALLLIPVNILHAYIPWKMWHKYSAGENNIFRLDSAVRTTRYVVIMFCSSIISGMLTGVIKTLVLKQKFVISVAFAIVGNFDICILIGIPLMIIASLFAFKLGHRGEKLRNLSLVEKILLYTVLIEVIAIVLTDLFAFAVEGMANVVIDWNIIYLYAVIIENVVTLFGLFIVGASISKEKATKRFQFTSCIVVSLLCIYVLFKAYGLDLMSYGSDVASTFGLNLATLLFAVVLYIICVCDKHQISSQSTWYMLLLLDIIFMIFIGCCTPVIEGNPRYNQVVIGCFSMYYEFGVISILCTLNFFKAGMNITKHQYKTACKIVNFLIIADSVLILSNPWSGLMFSMNDDGSWLAGPLAYAVTVVLLITDAVIFYMLFKEKAPLVEKIALAALLIAPLLGGFVYLGNGALYASDAFTLAAVTFCFGIIYTKRSSELGEKQKDLDLAASVQLSRLPKNFDIGSRDNFDIYALMKPAKEIGGDFYDFFEINDKHLAFGVADVSGKGSSAAIFMMRAITTIRNYSTSGMGLAEAMTKSNDSLHENNDAMLFVTAWTGALNYDTGSIKYVNAGHNYPFVIHKDGSVEQLVCTPDTMMAFFPGIEYHVHEYQMNEGDILFLYTDGVTDAQNPSEETFGDERLGKTLEKYASNNGCKSLCEIVDKEIYEFMDHADQFDDITMMAIKYNKSLA